MRKAKGFETAIEGGPARFTQIRPGLRSSSAVTRKQKGATKGLASADIVVQDKQLRYRHLMFGEDDVREPGDVGVAIKANFVPIEDNLKLVGINVTEDGGLPRGGLKRLVTLFGRSGRTRDAEVEGVVLQ